MHALSREPGTAVVLSLASNTAVPMYLLPHVVSRGWRSTHPLQADVAAKTVLEIAHLPLELVDLAPRRVDTFLAPRLQD